LRRHFSTASGSDRTKPIALIENSYVKVDSAIRSLPLAVLTRNLGS